MRHHFLQQRHTVSQEYNKIRGWKSRKVKIASTWQKISRIRDDNVPDSFVHSSCRLISASVTVGLTLSRDFTKSFNVSDGSRSSSDSTSDQDFSTASGSPGEQGVHLTISGSSSDTTCLKCVAEMTLRTGCISASRTRIDMSEPVYLANGFSAWTTWTTIDVTLRFGRPIRDSLYVSAHTV
jgi:hypothetical protein